MLAHVLSVFVGAARKTRVFVVVGGGAGSAPGQDLNAR